jgi:uncharacterized DUF497 family protein
MKIVEFLWPEDRVEHIAEHGVEPWEVEEVCDSSPLVLRTKAKGENPAYIVLGQTESGRFLTCIIIQMPRGKGYPVTARPMTTKERRRYSQWRKR